MSISAALKVAKAYISKHILAATGYIINNEVWRGSVRDVIKTIDKVSKICLVVNTGIRWKVIWTIAWEIGVHISVCSSIVVSGYSLLRATK
jgi:hypothetical protein